MPSISESQLWRKEGPSYEEWLEDLSLVPLEEQEAWIRDTLRDKEMLPIFGRYFFPHLIQGDDPVPLCHVDLCREMATKTNSGIIYPREHAKSTWEAIDTIHDIVYAIEPVILYIGPTMTDAEMHFGGIKHELEYNELLISVYGDLVPPETKFSKKWTNRHFETTNGINLIARGATKGRGIKIKGQRPTKIVIDDAETDEMVRNPKLRAKFHDWLYSVIIPSLDSSRGYVKMIGTALHDLAEVLAFYDQHGGIFRRAIENGKPLWEGRWSLEKLDAKRKEIGSRAFLREYMQQSTPDEEAGVKREWIESAEYTTLPLKNGFSGVMYLDPQSGESALADEYALTCLFREKQSVHRYVVEQEAGRASQFDQAKSVVRMWIKYKSVIRVIGIECVLSQVAVWQILMDWKARKINFNTPETPLKDRVEENDRNIPITKWSPKGKDKNARLQIYEPDFERGEIHLKPDMYELKNQVMFLGTGNLDHDDRADSLTGALELSGSGGTYGDKGVDRTRKGEYNDTSITGNLMKKTF